jgi:transposase
VSTVAVRRTVNVQDVSIETGISEPVIRRLAKNDQLRLPVLQFGNRYVVSREVLDEYLAQRKGDKVALSGLTKVFAREHDDGYSGAPAMDLSPHRSVLQALARTDPDPRVRHRADGLLLVASGLSLTHAARLFGCARNSLRTWGQRLLADGRVGLADRSRRGRPPKLDATARALLAQALAGSPLDNDYPVTTWTVLDLTDLLRRQGWPVSTATVYRALAAMGYRYRRPRHDLRHRQEAEAVASAKHVLAELQKRGLLPGLASGFSTWMSATCIPIPTWSRSGNDGAVP